MIARNEDSLHYLEDFPTRMVPGLLGKQTRQIQSANIHNLASWNAVPSTTDHNDSVDS